MAIEQHMMLMGGEDIGSPYKNEAGDIILPGRTMPMRMDKIHRAIIAATGRENPHALLEPSARDHMVGDIAMRFVEMYLPLGCTTETMDLPKPSHDRRPTDEEIDGKIERANIIYNGGGNTYKMRERWKRYNMIEKYLQAIRDGKVVAGHSAGFNIFCKSSVSNSFVLKESDRGVRGKGPFILKGIAAVPINGCPHADSESDYRWPTMERMMKEDNEKTVGVCIDEDGALELRGPDLANGIGEFRVIAQTEGAVVTRAFYLGDTLHTERIEETNEWHDFERFSSTSVKHVIA